jgi:hypothetical protein
MQKGPNAVKIVVSGIVAALWLSLAGCDGLFNPKVKTPEMDLSQGSIPIADGTGSYAFADTATNSSRDTSFTIVNSGDSTLAMTGNPLVALGGANADQFSVQAVPAKSVPAGDSISFTLRFAPTGAGSKTATVSIANDDKNENPYDFTITGTAIAAAAAAPEIKLLQDTTEIASGTGSFGFGELLVSNTLVRTFTIENTGTQDLVLSGSPRVQLGGANADQFSVTQPATGTLAGGGSTTFTVQFAPTSDGLKTAGLSIANNDSDEAPYTFQVDGTGTLAAVAEILVKQGSSTIADGTGAYAFPDSFLNESSAPVQFTIENAGTAALVLGGAPFVQITGANPVDFLVNAQPSSGSVAAGASTIFTVCFSPSSGSGLKTATISIANNDADENPYDFKISGNGKQHLGSKIRVRENGTEIPKDSVYSFPDVLTSGNSLKTFTIENIGDQDLNLWTANALAVINDAGGNFSLPSTVPANTTIVPGGSTTFGLQFNGGSSAGSKSAGLVINSTNASGADFTCTIQGKVTAAAAWHGYKTIDSVGTLGENGTSIAAVGDSVYISYYDLTNGHLKFAKSTDGGVTWPTIATVDNAFAVGYNSSIGVEGNNVYISYCDSSNGDLKFAKSTDGGSSWGTIKSIDTTGSVGMDTSLEAVGGCVYISYYDSSNTALKFAKSIDGGATWPTIITVDSADDSGEDSSLAVAGSNVYICYLHTIASGISGELKFAKSLDGGDSWLAENMKIVDTSLSPTSAECSIAVEQSTVYIAYTWSGQIMAARSIDGGATWPAENRSAIDGVGLGSGYTSIAAVGDNVYLSYYAYSYGNLKFAKSTNRGVNWPSGNVKFVDENGWIGLCTSIAVVDGGNTVYISYHDDDLADLKFAKSVDGGTTW